MDWRSRDYYLFSNHNCNTAIKYIKSRILSVKISSPYGHFNHNYSQKGNKWNITAYDGNFNDITGIRMPYCMVSCNKKESQKLEDIFKELKHYKYLDKFFKLSKEVCGQ